MDETHLQMDSKAIYVLKRLHGALHQGCTDINIVWTCKLTVNYLNQVAPWVHFHRKFTCKPLHLAILHLKQKLIVELREEPSVTNNICRQFRCNSITRQCQYMNSFVHDVQIFFGFSDIVSLEGGPGRTGAGGHQVEDSDRGHFTEVRSRTWEVNRSTR